MLPTKEDIIQSEWVSAYHHFNERLQERYGLSISFEEYKELSNAPYTLLKRDGNPANRGKRKLVLLTINGVEVLAIKQKDPNRYRTVLQHKNI